MGNLFGFLVAVGATLSEVEGWSPVKVRRSGFRRYEPHGSYRRMPDKCVCLLTNLMLSGIPLKAGNPTYLKREGG
jgi:hypothetical protein